MSIKVFDVGFGESILLEHEANALLIDCGSDGQNKTAYFNSISTQINNMRLNKLSLMISHFHRDHTNGFSSIADSLYTNCEKIYVPKIFTYEHPNLIDLSIMQTMLGTILNGKIENVLCWTLQNIQERRISVEEVERGNVINECDCDFEILWPIPKRINCLEFFKNTIDCINGYLKKTSGKNIDATTITQISDRIVHFLNAYKSGKYNELHGNMLGINSEIESICRLLIGQIPKMTKKERAKIYDRICKISSLIDDYSIVCQSRFHGNSTLFCGDIKKRNGIMKLLEDNRPLPSCAMYDNYRFIKAPHHGTDSAYYNFSTPCEYFIVSNGETRMPKRGKISSKYFDNNIDSQYTMICTHECGKYCYCARKKECNRYNNCVSSVINVVYTICYI